MKKFLPILSLLCLFSLGSCTRKEPAHSPVTPPSENEVTFAEDFTVTSSVLVVYFSKTHTTENVALSIRELTDADLFQIERKEPYPEAYTPTTEVAQEEKTATPDRNFRPIFRKMSLPDTIRFSWGSRSGGTPRRCLFFHF